jgi:hypothetical protein
MTDANHSKEDLLSKGKEKEPLEIIDSLTADEILKDLSDISRKYRNEIDEIILEIITDYFEKEDFATNVMNILIKTYHDQSKYHETEMVCV